MEADTIENVEKKAIIVIDTEVKAARLMFNDDYQAFIGALYVLENQKCITEENGAMLRQKLYALQSQLNKMEVAYHKVREIAEQKDNK